MGNRHIETWVITLKHKEDIVQQAGPITQMHCTVPPHIWWAYGPAYQRSGTDTIRERVNDHKRAPAGQSGAAAGS